MGARALLPEPPLLARDGNFIAAGYDGELDRLKQLRDESRQLVAQLQSAEPAANSSQYANAQPTRGA